MDDNHKQLEALQLQLKSMEDKMLGLLRASASQDPAMKFFSQTVSGAIVLGCVSNAVFAVLVKLTMYLYREFGRLRAKRLKMGRGRESTTKNGDAATDNHAALIATLHSEERSGQSQARLLQRKNTCKVVDLAATMNYNHVELRRPEAPLHTHHSAISTSSSNLAKSDLVQAACNGPVDDVDGNEHTAVDIEIEVTAVMADTASPEIVQEVKTVMKSISGTGAVHQSRGSFILTTKVLIPPATVTQLGAVAKKALDLDETCTFQLGELGIFYKQGGIVKMQEFIEGEVPLITRITTFQRKAYVIKGFYLIGAEIKASMRNKSVPLQVLEEIKLENGLEVVLLEIPHGTLDVDTRIYASKTISTVDGRSLDIRSAGITIDEIGTTASTGKWRIPGVWILVLGFNMVQLASLLPRHSLAVALASQLITWIISHCIVEFVLGPRVLRTLNRWVDSRPLRNYDVPVPREAEATKSDDLGNEDDDVDSEKDPRQLRKRAHDKPSDQVVIPVSDDNWEWPCYEKCFKDGKWCTVELKEKKEGGEAHPPFTSHRYAHPNRETSFYVKLLSAELVEVVRNCLPKKSADICIDKKIELKQIFWRRTGLQKYLMEESTSEEDAVVRCHVRHLLRLLERHFKETMVQYELMKEQQSVSWDMLWSFMVPGEEVCYKCPISDAQCYGTVNRADYKENRHLAERDFLQVVLDVMDYNGQGYIECQTKVNISGFDGCLPFTSLKVCPLQFFPQRKEMEEKFLNMGTQFYEAAMKQPFRFMRFNGSLNFKERSDFSDINPWQVRKINADGRVMIDLLNFARMNPGIPMSNAQPPCDVLTGRAPSPVCLEKPSDQELKLSPAVAYGFSFKLKKWGCFEVCGLREMKFNDGAFDALKMRSPDQKQILRRLVEDYVTEQAEPASADPISHKGEGCILLCHGPPGTGKTLTAEALAETLHRPLWSMSALELGETLAQLESTLSRVMDIARMWRAILVLDEADGYLERREQGISPTRNLMTGAFLRLLEYYRGVLFLTTNRASSFDDAILSRITLTIYYPPLDGEQRLQIWQTHLSRVGLHDVCDVPLQHYLNGRQIRNIVHLAQILARSSKEDLSLRHVLKAVAAFTDGCRDLMSV